MAETTQIRNPENPSMLLRVHTFEKAAVANTVTVQEDPWEGLQTASDPIKIVHNPNNPLVLGQLVEVSDILLQCISAMVVNVDGFGYELVRVDDPNDATPLPAEAKQEKALLELFLNFTNDREDITKVRQKLRYEIETCGYGALEVIRSLDGGIAELHNMPSHTIRISIPDDSPTLYFQRVRGIDGKFITVPRYRRFRRIVQLAGNNRKVYFKEFGDPRSINRETGRVEEGTVKPANEVIWYSLYCSYNPYGLPRWAGNIMAILGSRKAEEVNYLFFDNKTIPPLIITVSGGALTEETFNKLEHLFKHEIKGTERFHSPVIIEAVPASADNTLSGEKTSPVKIDVKPLTEFIEKDATFTQYRKQNRDNIRSSFKLPPIYTGDTTDYTRATAYESARVAEEQVFEPERKEFDYSFNRNILPELNINYWKLKSIGAKTSDDTVIVTAMGSVRDALPVGIIQEAVAEMRNVPKGNIAPELYTIPLGVMTAQARAEAAAANAPDKEDEPTDKEEKPVKKSEITPEVREMIVNFRNNLQAIVDRELNQ